MRKYAAILNSRQSLWPTGETDWIEQTKRALIWAGEKNYTVLTSVGMQTWEILVAFSSINRIRQKIIIPHFEKVDYNDRLSELMTEYDLVNKPVEYSLLEDDHSHSNFHSQRDAAIIAQADLLLPISIRSSGSLVKLIDEAKKRGQAIDNSFHCVYDHESTRQSYVINANQLNPELIQNYRDYLIHWTRTSNKAWPNERAIDYYRDIFKSTIYPRTAFDTLRRIVKTGKIIASSRHMPGYIATVSFSALPPEEVIPLMRWRARYHQMTFEPYGIGIEPGVAKEAGIEPVVYYDKSESVPADIPVWLTQSSGTKTDWRTEREHRSRGDFCLDKIPADKIIVFTRYKHEAEKLAIITGLKTVPMLDPSGQLT